MRRKRLIATAAIAALTVMMVTTLVVLAGCDEDAASQGANFRGVSNWGDGSGCLDDTGRDAGCVKADCTAGDDCDGACEGDCSGNCLDGGDRLGGGGCLGTVQESEPVCF